MIPTPSIIGYWMPFPYSFVIFNLFLGDSIGYWIPYLDDIKHMLPPTWLLSSDKNTSYAKGGEKSVSLIRSVCFVVLIPNESPNQHQLPFLEEVRWFWWSFFNHPHHPFRKDKPTTNCNPIHSPRIRFVQVGSHMPACPRFIIWFIMLSLTLIILMRMSSIWDLECNQSKPIVISDVVSPRATRSAPDRLYTIFLFHNYHVTIPTDC